MSRAKIQWMLNPSQEATVSDAKDVMSSKHGMTAHIPIVCRGSNCSYREVCIIEPAYIKEGERCPTEVAVILDRFDKYCRELEIFEQHEVDMSLVREMIDIEISILRADGIIAIDGNMLEEAAVGVDKQGNEITRREAHPMLDMKNSLRRERHRILNLLNSTRKDRTNGKLGDPSSKAVELLARALELEKQGKLKSSREGE